jgi:hypothetical protein
MAHLSHTPIVVEEFQGLYSRGYDQNTSDDEVPQNHFCDGLNYDFFGNVVGTRGGAHKDITISNLKRTAVYRRSGEAARLLLLTWDGATGKIYDSTNLAAAILTVTGMSDFACVVLYNRAFISPHNGVTGLSGEVVYIYDGTTARAACGAGPVSLPTLSVSGTAGNVEEGTHLVGVAWETNSGFITPPCTMQSIEMPGDFAIHLANIPLGPVYVSARWIICTKVITYNGNPEGFATYFALRIADNTTTSIDVDFFDVALIDSSDYLFDELTSIPAGVFLTTYATRLISGGENANSSLARVSKSAEPESHSSTSGFLLFDPSETAGITNGIEFRSAFYVTKGTHDYITEDNGDDPATWKVDTIDHGLGTPSSFGIGRVLDNTGANLDYYLVASLGGLQLFNGIYSQFPLSWKIERHWKRINKNYFKLVQVYNDVENKKIYVSVPLDASTVCSHLFVGDYKNGINHEDIRWSIWSFPFNIASIVVTIDTTTQAAYLSVGGTSNVYSISATQLNDDGTAIDSYVRLFLAYLAPSKGWIHHFSFIHVRAWGTGTLLITCQGLDGVTTLTAPSITLAATGGVEQDAKINFQNEKCSVKFRCNSGTNNFKLKYAQIYAKKMWANRPS